MLLHGSRVSPFQCVNWTGMKLQQHVMVSVAVIEFLFSQDVIDISQSGGLAWQNVPSKLRLWCKGSCNRYTLPQDDPSPYVANG